MLFLTPPPPRVKTRSLTWSLFHLSLGGINHINQIKGKVNTFKAINKYFQSFSLLWEAKKALKRLQTVKSDCNIRGNISADTPHVHAEGGNFSTTEDTSETNLAAGNQTCVAGVDCCISMSLSQWTAHDVAVLHARASSSYYLSIPLVYLCPLHSLHLLSARVCSWTINCCWGHETHDKRSSAGESKSRTFNFFFCIL